VTARAGLVVGLALVGACRSEPYTAAPGLVDFAVQRDSGRDAGSSVDALPMCSTHGLLQQVPFDEVELLGGPTSANLGTALRLRLRYTLRLGCDEPGPIDVIALPGNAVDNVTIQVWLFKATGCTAAAQSVSRIVVLPAKQLSSPKLLIRDASPGGTATLTLAPAAAAGSACTAKAPGQACKADCECQAADAKALCISFGPGLTRCGYSCSEDVDCPQAASFCDITAGFICNSSNACRAPGECALGQAVADCRCAPLDAQGPGVCTCDTDCGVGRICVGSVCKQPCVTKLDCPKSGDPTTQCVGGCMTGIPGP
jgi:hypothetical protein